VGTPMGTVQITESDHYDGQGKYAGGAEAERDDSMDMLQNA